MLTGGISTRAVESEEFEDPAHREGLGVAGVRDPGARIPYARNVTMACSRSSLDRRGRGLASLG